MMVQVNGNLFRFLCQFDPVGNYFPDLNPQNQTVFGSGGQELKTLGNIEGAYMVKGRTN